MGNIIYMNRFSMVFIMWYVLSVFNIYARDVIYHKINFICSLLNCPLGVGRQFYRTKDSQIFSELIFICIFSEIVVL